MPNGYASLSAMPIMFNGLYLSKRTRSAKDWRGALWTVEAMGATWCGCWFRFLLRTAVPFRKSPQGWDTCFELHLLTGKSLLRAFSLSHLIEMKTLCLQQASKPDSGLDEALPGLEFALDERVFQFGTLPLARGNATSPIAQTKPIPSRVTSYLSFGHEGVNGLVVMGENPPFQRDNSPPLVNKFLYRQGRLSCSTDPWVIT